MASLPTYDATLPIILASAQLAQQTNSSIETVTGGQGSLQDPFWAYASLESSRWNQTFPYVLRLFKRAPAGSQNTGGTTAPANGGWVADDSVIPPYFLPIPPEALSISTPWAITTIPTLGGIVEEHNAAPIRMISLQGTTGVLPLRGTPAANTALTAVQGIFAGTLQAVNGIAYGLQGLLSGPPQITNVVQSTPDVTTGSGYFQFQLLKRFLETYTTFKKQAAGRNYMLGLCIYKDQEIYLVSPQTFDLHRGGQSPWEYSYQLTFKAWRRILPTPGTANAYVYQPPARDPNTMAQILNRLQSAQAIMQGSINTLQAVQADVANIITQPVRQATLFVKRFLGVIVTVADLPANVITSLQEPILEAISLQGTVNATFLATSQLPASTVQAWINLSIASQKAATAASQTAGAAASLQGASPANLINETPLENFQFYSAINVASLNLRPSMAQAIQNEFNQNVQLQRQDFEGMVTGIQTFLNNYEASIGLGDPTYNQLYNLPVVVPTRAPTDADFQILYALNDTLLSLEALAASSSINQNTINAVDYIAGLATQAGIAFQQPAGKFLVPFPYNGTLELLSNQYLGDPNRWMEIAALNGLVDPFVDEVGFYTPLVANGNGAVLSIADGTNFFAQQVIYVSSARVPVVKCRVTAVRQVSPTLCLLYTDSSVNFSVMHLADSAQIQAFLPNTVNSTMSLYIPSPNAPNNDDFQEIAIPGVNYFDPLVQVGGIDLLLDSNNDLVITPDGGGRLAVGLTNIIQKVKLALTTPQGQLLHHPSYGFPVQPGSSTADNSAASILKACQTLLQGDPTFGPVQKVQVVKNGPSVTITLSVPISGTTKVIPVTVNIPG